MKSLWPVLLSLTVIALAIGFLVLAVRPHPSLEDLRHLEWRKVADKPEVPEETPEETPEA